MMDEMIRFLIGQGYIVLFLWVLFAQLGLPLPIAPILLAAGALAGIGKLNFAFVFGSAFLATLLSDQFWYQAGLRRGGKVLSFLCRISLDPDSCVHRTKRIFVRYGARSLLVAKFIPWLNTIGPPLAGIVRMSSLRFLFFDGIGVFIWVGVFTLLGYQFGHEIEEHVTSTHGMGAWIGLVVPVFLAAYILWKYIQRRRFLHQLNVARITPEEVKKKLDAGEDILIVDLRDALEFEIDPHTIPGALHLSVEELEVQHHQIPRDREIVLFCT
jgi:membrane protein DedA with SNARE-associated domain